MSDYLLDTNILRYWYDTHRPEHANVLTHVNSVRQPDPQFRYVSRLFISFITLGEIEYGHRVELTPNIAEQRAFATFVRDQCPEPLEFAEDVTKQYGDLRAWLFNNCSPKTKRAKAQRVEELVNPITARELGVQENDVWIAAHAMTHNLTLVTNDYGGHFSRLLKAFKPTLHVENWARPTGRYWDDKA